MAEQITSFVDLTPRECALLEWIAIDWLVRDNQDGITDRDRGFLRRMYKAGLIKAEPQLHIDGAPYDLLTGLTSQGEGIYQTLIDFRERVHNEGGQS